jgi:hypothetical protein
VIRELLSNRPALEGCELSAHTQLVCDRSIPLVVGRVPRVGGDLHCTVTSEDVFGCATTSRSNRSRAAIA